MKKFLLLLLAAALLVGLGLAYRAGHREAVAEAASDLPLKTASRVEVVNGETLVTLDPATRTLSGIGLAPLPAVSHRAEIPAYGSVVDLGPLTEQRHALATAHAQLARAKATLTVAQQEYDRSKALFAANQNVSEKTLQLAEGTWLAEKANLAAARAAVDAARATAGQRWGGVIAGWLAQGGPELDRLQRQEDRLVQVTLAPAQTAFNAPPQASVRRADGTLLAAKLVSPAARTDPKIQGPSFFYLVAAPDSGLLPGMSVVVLLPAGEPSPGVVVPASAVVWLQGKPWVYAEMRADQFARREVSTDQPVADGWVQPASFAPGQPVVTHGAQLLLSEEFRAQITVGD